jgi:short-subunit dehydrogenase
LRLAGGVEGSEMAEVALITGASSGIGAAFARAYAAQGRDLVLVARREERLRELAGELGSRHGVDAGVCAVDLATPEGPAQLVAEIAQRGHTVVALVNNAGFGTVGRPFAQVPVDRSMEMMRLNCDAVVALTAHYLPGMLARGSGDIVNVGSIAGFQPLSTMALYAATKAFVLNFSLAVWGETRRSGVRVLALCPGDTNTEWETVAGVPEGRRNLQGMTAEAVVQRAFQALRRNQGYAIVAKPGQGVPIRIAGLVPRRLLARATARFMPQYD